MISTELLTEACAAKRFLLHNERAVGDAFTNRNCPKRVVEKRTNDLRTKPIMNERDVMR